MPIPKTYFKVSPVSGALVNPEGKPVSGATIRFSQSLDDLACGSPSFTSVTSSSGKFEFPGETGFLYWVAPAPTTYMRTFRLCAVTAESNLGWNARVYGGPEAPSLVEPICELSRTELQCQLKITP